MIDESRVADRTFVALSDRLVAGVDQPAHWNELTELCAERLGMRSVGLLAPTGDGELDLYAASSETAELLGRYELAYEQGPGVDAFRTGERVECADMSAATLRWPRFAPVAAGVGIAAAHGLPCRLQGEVVGVLTLYRTAAGPLRVAHADLARGLANVLALGITAHRGRAFAVRAAQLQAALVSRVTIEQAKGMLAERANIPVDEAFTILRTYARRHGLKLRDVARDLMSGALSLPAGHTAGTDRRRGRGSGSSSG